MNDHKNITTFDITWKIPFNIRLKIILICNDNWCFSDKTCTFNRFHIKSDKFLTNNNLIPLFICASNPFPSRLTVSIPMCINISTPSSETMPTACLFGKSTVTVPFTGETNSPWFGSITRPYPITPDENTGSVAWLSDLTWPASGLITSVVSVKTVGSTKPSEASLSVSCACPSSSVFEEYQYHSNHNINNHNNRKDSPILGFNRENSWKTTNTNRVCLDAKDCWK